MQGLKVGHFSHYDKGTGVTVFLFTREARGSYVICGAGPASCELAPLDPEMSVGTVHALMFGGGSAFGLHASLGVMNYLVENKIGLKLPHGLVPIVPAACVYDLFYKAAHYPTAEDAYHACIHAKENDVASGQIGAGTGATVGKLPGKKRMTGGIGRAEIITESGLQVVAYALVNAVGDVYNQGKIIAGAVSETGEFINCEKFLLSGTHFEIFPAKGNTTLVAVFTNAKLSKPALKRVAKMSIAGMARSISPIFTCYDGDIAFAFSLGEFDAPVIAVGTMAAEAVRLSIIDAVKNSQVV